MVSGSTEKSVVTKMLIFIVEMYTPGEIVEARKQFTAETAENALLTAKDWINDSAHNATSLRVVDRDGIILFDKLVSDFN